MSIMGLVIFFPSFHETAQNTSKWIHAPGTPNYTFYTFRCVYTQTYVQTNKTTRKHKFEIGETGLFFFKGCLTFRSPGPTEKMIRFNATLH